MGMTVGCALSAEPWYVGGWMQRQGAPLNQWSGQTLGPEQELVSSSTLICSLFCPRCSDHRFTTSWESLVKVKTLQPQASTCVDPLALCWPSLLPSPGELGARGT